MAPKSAVAQVKIGGSESNWGERQVRSMVGSSLTIAVIVCGTALLMNVIPWGIESDWMVELVMLGFASFFIPIHIGDCAVRTRDALYGLNVYDQLTTTMFATERFRGLKWPVLVWAAAISAIVVLSMLIDSEIFAVIATILTSLSVVQSMTYLHYVGMRDWRDDDTADVDKLSARVSPLGFVKLVAPSQLLVSLSVLSAFETALLARSQGVSPLTIIAAVLTIAMGIAAYALCRPLAVQLDAMKTQIEPECATATQG